MNEERRTENEELGTPARQLGSNELYPARSHQLAPGQPATCEVAADRRAEEEQ
jgi:hypothetical protein